MNGRAKSLLTAGIALLALMGEPAQASANEARPLTFGVVPQQSASKLGELWIPLLNLLGEKTGRHIRFETAKDITTFERRLTEGAYDVAYMNPLHYEIYHRKAGYLAFARERDKRLRGVVVVHKDSPYRELEDLGGEYLAFPSPLAFAASVLPRVQFDREDVRITPNYVGSHDSVYRSVAKGLFSGGGGIERTLDGVDEGVRSKLRIIWTSESYSPHAFAAHPRLPRTVVQSLQNTLSDMWLDPRGQQVLQAINLGVIEPAQDQDWDDVRVLCEAIPSMMGRERDQ